ncbi:MAG: hypothetical protein IT318_23980 [Anaerolineales bacterium]|nr:hypothetical protein [Anaerolineales bacterium]
MKMNHDPLRNYFDARGQALTEHDRAVQAENIAKGNMVGWGLLGGLASALLFWTPLALGLFTRDARWFCAAGAVFGLALGALVSYGRRRP